jgi:sirohydrochlorin cobaltochelatase
MTVQYTSTAIVLFAHGSRDPNWRLPFESILRDLKDHFDGPCALAFLENMQPSLDEAIDEVAQLGATTVQVIPLFLAVGGHLRKDLPVLLEQAKILHCGITIQVCEAAGENDAVQKALVNFALNQTKRT